MSKRSKKYLALIIYCLCFFTVWTVFELYIKTNIDSQIIKSGVIKPLLWVLPAMLLIHKFSDSVSIGLKEMFTTKVKWRRYLPGYTLLIVYVLFCGFFLSGGFSFSVTLNSMIIVLFVGITEEMVFRGWLLNAIIGDMPKWSAIAINAFLFLAVHFPRWIQEGVFVSTFTSFSFIVLIALSVIFSISFIKSKNILIPITMHMLYDFMMFVFLPQAS